MTEQILDILQFYNLQNQTEHTIPENYEEIEKNIQISVNELSGCHGSASVNHFGSVVFTGVTAKLQRIFNSENVEFSNYRFNLQYSSQSSCDQKNNQQNSQAFTKILQTIFDKNEIIDKSSLFISVKTKAEENGDEKDDLKITQFAVILSINVCFIDNSQPQMDAILPSILIAIKNAKFPAIAFNCASHELRRINTACDDDITLPSQMHPSEKQLWREIRIQPRIKQVPLAFTLLCSSVGCEIDDVIEQNEFSLLPANSRIHLMHASLAGIAANSANSQRKFVYSSLVIDQSGNLLNLSISGCDFSAQFVRSLLACAQSHYRTFYEHVYKLYLE